MAQVLVQPEEAAKKAAEAKRAEAPGVLVARAALDAREANKRTPVGSPRTIADNGGKPVEFKFMTQPNVVVFLDVDLAARNERNERDAALIHVRVTYELKEPKKVKVGGAWLEQTEETLDLAFKRYSGGSDQFRLSASNPQGLYKQVASKLDEERLDHGRIAGLEVTAGETNVNCTTFVQEALAQAGRKRISGNPKKDVVEAEREGKLAVYTRADAKAGRIKSDVGSVAVFLREVKPGEPVEGVDVYTRRGKPYRVSHVALFTGKNEMTHASVNSNEIETTPINPYVAGAFDAVAVINVSHFKPINAEMAGIAPLEAKKKG